MFRKSILGIVALATLSLVGALAPPAGAVEGDQTTLQLTSTSAVVPLVGDFNGDGADDILWYGRGTAPDSMWFNSPIAPGTVNGHLNSFTMKAININGNYAPVVGDFNGDRIDDVFWYQAGTGADSAWFFKADKTFTSVAQTVNGNYRPIVGNFVANVSPEGIGEIPPERDDIFWYPLTAGNSSLSAGNANKTFTTQIFGARAPVGAQTLLGQFEHTSGTPTMDILFYVPGTGADSMWISNGAGNFTRTAKVINGDFRGIVGDFNEQGSFLPVPSLTISAYGTPGKEALDDMADGCFNGNLQACDALHIFTDVNFAGNSQYHDYSETCGGRRGDGGPNCEVTVVLPTPPIGLSDILWHGVGVRPDRLWMNNGSGFDSTAQEIGGNALATVVPSGPEGTVGGDRILWNNLTGDDTIWVPSGPGDFSVTPVPARAAGQRALAADFAAYAVGSQYRQNEILWYAPGNGADQKESISLAAGGSWT